MSVESSLQSLLSWAATRLPATDSENQTNTEPDSASSSSSHAASKHKASSSSASSVTHFPLPGCSLLTAQSIPHAGIGLVASRDFDGAHTLFHIPASTQIRAEDCAYKHLLPLKSDPWISMILLLLREFSLGASSSLAPYLASLPTRLDMPMLWSKTQLRELKGVTFLQRIHYFDLAGDWNDKIKPFMHKHEKELGFDLRRCDYDQYCLYVAIILSRGFRPKCNMNLGPYLVPVLDLLNTTSLDLDVDPSPSSGSESNNKSSSSSSGSSKFHKRINADCRWEFGGANGDDYSSPTLRVLSKPSFYYSQGQQIYIPYGSQNLSNTALLVRYGFVEGSHPQSENPHDEVTIDTKLIIDLFHGGAGTDNAQEQDEEEIEARHLHQQKKKKKAEADSRKAAAAASPSSSKSPRKSLGNDKLGDDDAVSEDGSSCGFDEELHAAHLDFVNNLPFSYFTVPATGELPLRMLQLLSVMLGHTRQEVYGNLCNFDEEERLRKEKEKEEQDRKQAFEDGLKAAGRDPSTPESRAAYATLVAAMKADSPAEDEDEEGGFSFTADMVQNIDARSRIDIESNDDIFERSFFVLHHLLSSYDTTLEEDAALLEQVQLANAEDATSVRRELAIKIRMSEKRILYRALEKIQDRVKASLLDDGSEEEMEDVAEAELDAGDGVMQAVQRALMKRQQGQAADGEEDEEEGDGIGADHVDPNIINPALIQMLTNQRRPATKRKENENDADEQGENDDDEEAEEDDEQHGQQAGGLKIVYDKSKAVAKRKQEHAKKKRKN